MRLSIHSVRLRLTLWYAGILAVVLLVFALAVYLFVVRNLQTNIDEALHGQVQQAGRRTAARIESSAARAASGKPAVRAPLAALVLQIRSGQRESTNQGLHITLQSGRESCGSIVGAAPGRKIPLRYCIRLIYQHGRPVGGVEVVQSLVGVDSALEWLRLALLLGIPLALLLAMGGGWLLAGRALQPVDALTGMARSISATDLSRRINLHRQDELGRLAGTFDDMIGRLERAFQEQRRLTADVSHELRSPLTILETQTSLALRRERTPQEYRDVLASVQEEVERMSRLVEGMLFLARADAGEEPLHVEDVRLQELAVRVVDVMGPVAADRGVRLQLSGPRVTVPGDEGRLRQLLLNLVQNALEHTPRGGSVFIETGIHDDARLTVRDTGEGIPPDDLPHIFDRFYRGDRSRQRGSENSGLGLSIVHWIVEAHGGRIEARSRPGNGTQFDVYLPLRAPVEAI